MLLKGSYFVPNLQKNETFFFRRFDIRLSDIKVSLNFVIVNILSSSTTKISFNEIKIFPNYS